MKILFRIIFVLIICIIFILKINIKILAQYLNFHIIIPLLLVQPFMLLSLSMIAARHAILAWTPPAPFWPTFKAVALSVGFNTVLPSRISEFIKPVYLNSHIGIPISAGLAAVFLERMLDLIILGLLTLLSMLLLIDVNNIFFVILMGLALIIIVTLPYLEHFWINLSLHLPIKFIRKFSQKFFIHASTRIKQGNFYKALVYGLIAWSCSFIGMATFLHFAGSIPIKLNGVLAVFVAVIIGGAVPALPGGFGTYEAAAVFTLKKFGYSSEEALVLALALHISQIAISVFSSIIIVMTEKIGFSAILQKVKTVTKI